MRHALSVLADPGVPDACMIAREEGWPAGPRRLRGHNPRTLGLAAAWTFPGKAQARAAERAAQRLFPLQRRPGGAWFDLPAAMAVRRLAGPDLLGPPSTLAVDAAPGRPDAPDAPDGWTDLRPAMARLRWQFWLFGEDGPQRRLKLAGGAAHDSAFGLGFDGNPWPVRLVAGFEHRRAVAADDDGNRAPNARMQAAWQEIQEVMGDPAAGGGWLRPGIRAEDVASVLDWFQVVPFRLDRPKPPGARRKEPGAPAMEIGAVPPQARVAPCPSIHGPGAAPAARDDR